MKMYDLRTMGWALAWTVTGFASPGWAEAPPAGVLAPAGGGQGFLHVQVSGVNLAYRACAEAPCPFTGSESALALPAGTSPSEVVVESLAIGNGRHVLWAHGPSFGALLAATPGSSNEARVLWSGITGLVKGEPGEKYGEQLQVSEPEDDKTVRVLVGDLREEVSICGRPSLLSPKVLDARDLAWKAAKVQRLRQDERDAAVSIDATPSTAASPAGTARLLQGAAASSGVGTPAALTDGDLESVWSENRGGDGKGEFIQLNAPEQVEITAVSIVSRPPTKEVVKGAGPRRLWLATRDQLFAVRFVEDPWAHPGAAYDVKFPAPIKTSCLAIVLDEAYAKGRDPDVDVTLAEITAHTEFDGKADAPALVGALAGGQARSRMAAAILARGGDAAYQAVAQGYPSLDDAGRVLALEIIDNAPCAESAPLYVEALDLGRGGEVRHASDRLLRCQRAAAPALAAALASGSDRQKVGVAHLLALVAPDTAVTSIVASLPGAKPEVRAELRAALAKASGSPVAQKALTEELADAALPAVATLDLLRAVTARPYASSEASQAFARLAASSADFRTRYLLLGPAAVLAKEGDTRAETFLLSVASAEPDSHLRARAAEVLGALPKALDPLTRALTDSDPRVRDAALSSVGRLIDPKGAKVQVQVWPARLFPEVEELLGSDPFTYVRGHAAEALQFAPPGEDADGPLARALTDISPQVRARVVDVLGRRGSRAHADEIRDRLDDVDEILDVRTRAARALGRLCDAHSLDRLTELAHAAASATVNSADLVIGASAAAALAHLNPPDLAKRLAPLSDKGAPRLAQEVARVALASTDRCR